MVGLCKCEMFVRYVVCIRVTLCGNIALQEVLTPTVVLHDHCYLVVLILLSPLFMVSFSFVSFLYFVKYFMNIFFTRTQSTEFFNS